MEYETMQSQKLYWSSSELFRKAKRNSRIELLLHSSVECLCLRRSVQPNKKWNKKKRKTWMTEQIR